MEDQEVCLLQIQMQTQMICPTISLAISNYLEYIEIYFRQRFTMRQEILHVFCPCFKKN